MEVTLRQVALAVIFPVNPVCGRERLINKVGLIPRCGLFLV